MLIAYATTTCIPLCVQAPRLCVLLLLVLAAIAVNFAAGACPHAAGLATLPPPTDTHKSPVAPP